MTKVGTTAFHEPERNERINVGRTHTCTDEEMIKFNAHTMLLRYSLSAKGLKRHTYV